MTREDIIALAREVGFCHDTNEWWEPRCADWSCEYCKDRPSQPLQDEAAHWDLCENLDDK